jgi:rhodanese-related sulfurtransferase
VGLFLERNGFSNLYNLQGGVNAWADQIEPTMPRY